MNIRTLKRGLLIFVPLYILACSSTSKMSLSEMGAQGLKIDYNTKAGFSARYEMSSDQDVTQDMMGQKQKFSTNTKSVVNMTVSEIKANAIIYDLDYESVNINTNMPNAPNMDSFKEELLKAKIHIESDESGNVSNISGLGTLKETQLGTNLEIGLKSIFPVFSSNKVKFGDTWTQDTDETVTSGPLEITIKTKTTYTLAGVEQALNRECLKINFETKSTLSGSGNQGGADLTYDAIGSGSGEIFFDYGDGIVVSQSSSESSEGVVVVVAQGLDIPVSTTEVSKRTLME